MATLGTTAWVSATAALLVALSAGSCSSSGSSQSAGGAPDASADGTAGVPCATDAECAAKVPATTPAHCGTGQCNAIQGVCVFSAKDEDGDGHPAANCKSTGGVAIVDGDDCNDHDPNLYPGHAETCTTLPDGGVPPGVLCAAGELTCLPGGVQSPCTNTVACVDKACISGKCQDGCEIGGTFFGTGTIQPNDPCQTCQPTKSTTAWSPLADDTPCGNGQSCANGQCGTQCVIGGTIYPPGTVDPSDACKSCQPGTSTSGWTPLAEGSGCGAGEYCSMGTCASGCLIAGTFQAAGTVNPADACQSCVPATSSTSWSPTGADGTSCGAAQVCASGHCQSGCYLGGTFVAPSTPDPNNACQACQPAMSTTTFTAIPDGTTCTGGTCCSGTCVDLGTDPNNCSACGHACTAATNPGCTAGLCNYTLVRNNQATADAIAINATNVFLVGTGNLNGYLDSVPLAGGLSKGIGGALGYPLFVVIDATSAYWANLGTTPGAIFKTPLGGGTTTTLATPTWGGVEWGGSGGYTVTMAVDSTRVYWTDTAAGTIVSVPIGGGTSTTFASGLSRPTGLVVDATSAYFTCNGNGTVLKAPLGGGATVTLASGQNMPSNAPAGITVDATSVYWASAGNGTVVKTLLTGGTPVTLASSLSAPVFVAVDGTSIYWTDMTAGTVSKAPLTGGATTTLAAGQNVPWAIAVDATSVYWTNDVFPNGTLMKAPK